MTNPNFIPIEGNWDLNGWIQENQLVYESRIYDVINGKNHQNVAFGLFEGPNRDSPMAHHCARLFSIDSVRRKVKVLKRNRATEGFPSVDWPRKPRMLPRFFARQISRFEPLSQR